jgi:hypothetical protein
MATSEVTTTLQVVHMARVLAESEEEAAEKYLNGDVVEECYYISDIDEPTSMVVEQQEEEEPGYGLV